MQTHELMLDILAFIEHLIHRCSQLNLNTPLLLTKTHCLWLYPAKYCDDLISVVTCRLQPGLLLPAILFPSSPSSSSAHSMTALDDPDEYAQYDAEFLALLANLDLRDVPSTPSSSPATSNSTNIDSSGLTHSPRLDPGPTGRRLLPCIILNRPPVADTQWNGRLLAALLKVYTTVMRMLSSEVLASRASKKRRTSFSVVSAAVCFSDGQKRILCVRRTLMDSNHRLPISAIPALPQPLPEDLGANPLHETEALDDRWYMVYCGIRPGVYRSHLECQLNTLGVRGALHESVIGRACAFSKYAKAESAGAVAHGTRAELKLQPPEEQARVAALNKEYQATYRERTLLKERKKATAAYQDRYGFAMYNIYMKAQRQRRRMANDKHQRQEAHYYFSDGDVEGDGDDHQNLADGA
ncbi:hypothetical protein B0H13DRAFT_2331944 [Mycena leptocephala]|nr:hypothetical protein B0H13DRAFT_2331944 [Mycena leptocephala]